jgi:hypothetical protein
VEDVWLGDEQLRVDPFAFAECGYNHCCGRQTIQVTVSHYGSHMPERANRAI